MTHWRVDKERPRRTAEASSPSHGGLEGRVGTTSTHVVMGEGKERPRRDEVTAGFSHPTRLVLVGGSKR
jgi:hypothetical protein